MDDSLVEMSLPADLFSIPGSFVTIVCSCGRDIVIRTGQVPRFPPRENNRIKMMKTVGLWNSV